MQNNKRTADSRENYEAPKCEVIEVTGEGLLCGSDYNVNASHRGFVEDDEEYDVEW